MDQLKRSNLKNLAIIGSGPTALYLLKYISDNLEIFKGEIQEIDIFEKEEVLGMGMPYHPKTTDIYNLANISSEEIPLMHCTFADWLRSQDKALLNKLNIEDAPIDDSEVYSRVALGHYFEEQFKSLITLIKATGIKINQNVNCKIVDIYKEEDNSLTIIDSQNKHQNYSTVIIANGHEWKGEDVQKAGYYASPWPIHKIIPKVGDTYNFPVGTLGASLSAFDVVTSLTHRHGKFIKKDKKLSYLKNTDNPEFKIVLHSAEGWLPHLQYEQQEPIREIYRHFSREQLLELINDDGFLEIENYFDKLCRPVFIKAFKKDKLFPIAEQLINPDFSFKDLVKLMSEKHHYTDSFEGMKIEMLTAKESVYKKIPIYWMETLDDLMYSLNYHAELLPAEDHLFFHQEIMSFLMNVIAALPLQSAEILLALYDAGSIELKTGKVKFPEDAFDGDITKITVEKPDGRSEEIKYKLFVNCGGGHKLDVEDYPFQSLVKNGIVRNAPAKFLSRKASEVNTKTNDKASVYDDNGTLKMDLSGIDIDSSYRTINRKGFANEFLYDINFTHTNGLRPYSYGLQACSATSLIVVESLKAEILDRKNVGDNIEDITLLYKEIEGL